MKKALTKGLLASAALLLLASCDQQPQHDRHKHKPLYGRVYESDTGTQYVRTYDPNTGQFWFWMYMTSGPDSSSSTSSRGSWQQVPSMPSNVTATSRVIAEKDGKPDEEAQEMEEVQGEDVVDEATSVQEAKDEAEETEASEPESSPSESTEGSSPASSEGSSSSSSSSDGGGSSGGDGGGGGGGDGGGD